MSNLCQHITYSTSNGQLHASDEWIQTNESEKRILSEVTNDLLTFCSFSIETKARACLRVIFLYETSDLDSDYDNVNHSNKPIQQFVQ